MPQALATARYLPTLTLLVLAGFSAAKAQQPSISTVDFRSGVEQETFSMVNQYRKASDLPPLVWDGNIAEIARAHSRDMATGEVGFGHEGFSDRVSELKAIMSGVWGAGENVLMTSNLDEVARSAVTMWLHSPHHLKNIRGDYNYSGLGVWQDKTGAIYFTQIFVKTEPVAKETQAAPELLTPFGILATSTTARNGR